MVECNHCHGDLQNGFCELCDRLIECCFPDCGCDGARLCMAERGASDRALSGNVEGMWTGKTTEQRKAVMELVRQTAEEKRLEQGESDGD